MVAIPMGEPADQASELDLDLEEPGLAGWRSFLEAYFRIIRALQTEMAAERGLELAEYVAMFHLYTAENHSMRMSDLADVTFRSRSAMTRVIDRMERGGYVVRMPVPGNQRSKLAVLTPTGLLLLRQAFPVHHDRLTATVVSRLTAEEWKTLRGLMDRLG
jgi:DNA-binding MarR family transcriptional regulator